MVALTLATALSTPALAQTSDAEKAARAHVATSQQFFNLGKFAEALAELEEAYKLKAAPGLLFNIAQCHRQLKHYERAAFFYKAYAEAGSGEQVAVAKNFAADMEALDAKEKAEAREAQAARDAEAKRLEEKATRERELQLELTRLAANRAAADASAQPSTPVWKKWWFWTGVGVVAVGATVAGVAAAPRSRSTSLGEVNLR